MDGLDVPVDPYSKRMVSESYLALEVVNEFGLEPFVESEDGRVLVRKERGACVFLDDKKLCKIHGQLGIEKKPMICRTFPYSITPTPDGYYIGISHYCTAAKMNTGRPLSDHQKEIEEILKGIKFTDLGFEPLALGGEATIEWEAYKKLEDWLAVHARRHGYKKAMAFGLTLASTWILNHPSVTNETVTSWLVEQPPDRVSEAAIIQETLLFSAAAIVAFLAADANQQAQAVTESILNGEAFRFPEWDWEGSAREVFASAARVPKDELVDRYLFSLLYIKQLGKQRPVFHNLALLYLLPDLIAFYSGLSSLARGVQQPQREDIERAVELIERDIVTHGRNVGPILLMLGDGVLDQLAIYSPEEVDTTRPGQ